MKQKSKIFCSVNMNEAKLYLTFVDGKVLYGKQKGKEVNNNKRIKDAIKESYTWMKKIINGGK